MTGLGGERDLAPAPITQLSPAPLAHVALTPVQVTPASAVATVPAAVSAPVRVSLVLPAKNEARNLAWVLEQIPDVVDEVILVDGDSVDATLTMALACRPDIRVVKQSGPGKGNALRAGFLAARGEFIVMMDADGSMSPNEILHYIHFLSNGYDFVKGSRFMAGGGSLDITAIRRAGNTALLTLVNRLYDTNLTDLCYGFCAFRRRYLDHLSLSADGFDIEAEMIVHAVQAGLRIAEVPSLELPRRSGRSNLRAVRDGQRVLRVVLRDHREGVSGRLVQSVRRRSRTRADAAALATVAMPVTSGPVEQSGS
jgi:glycosyltransferase involved in cell wall biosynthesis